MKDLDRIKTECCEIWIDAEGILRMETFDGAELDLAATKACFDAYRTLGCDKKKVLQLMLVKDNNSMTTEGRNYAAQMGDQFFIASAVVNNSLAIRLIVNFYNSFYKHQVPFKMFPTEKKAVQWLKSFRK